VADICLKYLNLSNGAGGVNACTIPDGGFGPLVYTPVSPTICGHLEGIDNALSAIIGGSLAQSGAVDPTSALTVPDFIGQVFVNPVTDQVWVAKSLLPGDWIEVTGFVGGGITELTGDVLAGPGSGAQAATIANNAITSAKILNGAVTTLKIGGAAVTNDRLAFMAPATVKLNPDAMVGQLPTDLALGANTVLGRQGGNIVAAQVATGQIADDAVNFAKMQDINTARLLGRGDGGVGSIEELTLGPEFSFAAGALTLSLDVGDLADVDLTGLSVNDVLAWDGSDWVPAAPSGGITGPGASTDRALVRWDNVLGAAVLDSNWVLDDTGWMGAPDDEVGPGGDLPTYGFINSGGGMWFDAGGSPQRVVLRGPDGNDQLAIVAGFGIPNVEVYGDLDMSANSLHNVDQINGLGTDEFILTTTDFVTGATITPALFGPVFAAVAGRYEFELVAHLDADDSGSQVVYGFVSAPIGGATLTNVAVSHERFRNGAHDVHGNQGAMVRNWGAAFHLNNTTVQVRGTFNVSSPGNMSQELYRVGGSGNLTLLEGSFVRLRRIA